MAIGKRWRQNLAASLIGRILLSAVFLLAASAKISNFESFEIILNKSQLLGGGYAHWIGMAIIAVELVAVAGLWFARTRPFSLHLFVGLCSLFIAYSAWRWTQNIPVPCSCFGALFKMSPAQSIGLNLGLIAITLFLLESEPTNIDRQIQRGATEGSLQPETA